MKAEQQHAVGDLGPDAADLHQFPAGLLQRHRGDGVQPHLAGADLLRSVDQIPGAKPAAQRRQLFGGDGGQLLRGGEGEEAAVADGLPKQAAQPLDDSLDPLDVVVLADNKAAQRLPAVLTQDTDARRKLDGPPQSLVLGQHSLDSGVVGVQVKVGLPEAAEGFGVGAVKQQGVRLRLGDSQSVSAGPALPAAVRQLRKGEALPAVQNLRQRKILHALNKGSVRMRNAFQVQSVDLLCAAASGSRDVRPVYHRFDTAVNDEKRMKICGQ